MVLMHLMAMVIVDIPRSGMHVVRMMMPVVAMVAREMPRCGMGLKGMLQMTKSDMPVESMMPEVVMPLVDMCRQR